MFASALRATTRAPAARAFATNATYTARAIPSLAVAGGALVLGGGLVGGAAFAAPADVDWKALAEDLENLFDDERSHNPGQDGFPGNSGGAGDIGPMMVRLAWHCSGTYSCGAGNGGSDGATMRFKDEAGHGGNAGLGSARDLLEPIKSKYPGITYADLYIFAGKVAIESMGGPDIKFKCGRTDADAPPKCPKDDQRFSPDGRLPDAALGAQHIRDVFYRMGFNDQEIVALSGGHALGRCHTDRSGFWGPWTRAPTTVSNEYYRLLLEEKWTVKKTHKGQAWTGPLQYEDPTGELMMLPTDVSLTSDPKFRVWTEKYAQDEDLFMRDFGKAWTKLTELGCSGLESTDGTMGWRKYIFFGPRE